jgi:hypothetical protein
MSLACRKRAEIPVYSFEKHARLEQTTSIYSPHVLVLEGIFALYDPRVLELMDMKVGLAWLICGHAAETDVMLDLLRGRCGYLPVEEECVSLCSISLCPGELTEFQYCAIKETVDETLMESSNNGSPLSSQISKRYLALGLPRSRRLTLHVVRRPPAEGRRRDRTTGRREPRRHV